MKNCTPIFLLLAFCIVSCKPFDKEKAKEPVKLSKNDIALYNTLNSYILKDKKALRLQVRELDYGDTLYLSTNSYYIYKLNKRLYKPVITKLETRSVFEDDISIGHNNTVIFRLKSETDTHTGDFNESYFHELIFENGADKYVFQGDEEIFLDTIIAPGIRYVGFYMQTGW